MYSNGLELSTSLTRIVSRDNDLTKRRLQPNKAALVDLFSQYSHVCVGKAESFLGFAIVPIEVRLAVLSSISRIEQQLLKIDRTHEEETLILIAATALRVDSLGTVIPAAGATKVAQADTARGIIKSFRGIPSGYHDRRGRRMTGVYYNLYENRKCTNDNVIERGIPSTVKI